MQQYTIRINRNKVHNASEGKYLLLTQYLESNHSHFHKILFTKKSLLIIKEKVCYFFSSF